MKLSLALVTIYSSLLPLAWSSLTTKSVLEACLTEYCTQSPAGGAVPTRTTTYTLTQVGTVTVKPTATVTPSASTVTVKSTVFVTSTKTIGSVNTLTSTSTVLSTSQATASATVTITVAPVVSVTVSGSTTTVPTSPGQVFQSDSPYNKRKRDLEQGFANPHLPRNNPSPTTSTTQSHYPTAVTCGLLVDIYGFSTVTASKTNTVTAPAPTSKVTSTVTGTITATACNAKVTKTVTTTSVIAVTTTVTASVTVTSGSPTTVQEPESTFYAACVDENLLTYDNTAGGYPFTGVIGNNDSFATVAAATSYDCCVACQTNGDCGGAFFGFGNEGGVCTIDLPGGTCDPNYNLGALFGASDWDSALTVIAGPCGQGAYDGYFVNF